MILLLLKEPYFLLISLINELILLCYFKILYNFYLIIY